MNNNTIRCKKLATIFSDRKYVVRPFFRRKQVSMNAYVAIIFRHACLSVFVWRRVVLHIFYPKQLLRISGTLWCYYSKGFSITVKWIYGNFLQHISGDSHYYNKILLWVPIISYERYSSLIMSIISFWPCQKCTSIFIQLSVILKY